MPHHNIYFLLMKTIWSIFGYWKTKKRENIYKKVFGYVERLESGLHDWPKPEWNKSCIIKTDWKYLYTHCPIFTPRIVGVKTFWDHKIQGIVGKCRLVSMEPWQAKPISGTHKYYSHLHGSHGNEMIEKKYYNFFKYISWHFPQKEIRKV